MTRLRSITEFNLTNQRLVIREDFNISIIQDHIVNDRCIYAALPTIEYALSQKASVILLSHLGHPTQADTERLSLALLINNLSSYLNQPVKFVKDWVNGVNISPGEVVLCENVRFQSGETTNDPNLSRKIAELGDIFVMDAFGAAHLITASTVGVMQYANQVCAGLLFLSELENLEPLQHPKRPFVAVIGGTKAATTLSTLEVIIPKVDHLLLGGSIAHAFLATQFASIKSNFKEKTLLNKIKHLLQSAEAHHCKIHLPKDLLVNGTDVDTNTIEAKSVETIQSYAQIVDIGPLTIEDYTTTLKAAHTIFWNGPMGIFEKNTFQKGTHAIAKEIANNNGFSIAGGSETISAIGQYQLYPTCVSTGGEALLAWLTGEPLPVVKALHQWQTDPKMIV